MKLKITIPLAVTLAPLVGVFAALAHADPPQPPPEAIAACASAKEGDACTVKFGDREMSGTCATTPDKVLACRPSGPPPIPKEALDACSGAAAGDACSMTLGGQTMSGTCTATPDRGLACRPEGR